MRHFFFFLLIVEILLKGKSYKDSSLTYIRRTSRGKEAQKMLHEAGESNKRRTDKSKETNSSRLNILYVKLGRVGVKPQP